MPETNGAEAFTMLGAIGASTSRIALGTGIVPLQLRPPTLGAMAAVTLDHLFGRTVYLGVGVSSPVIIRDWHGLDHGDDLVAMTRDYVAVVREAVSGGRFSHDGNRFQVRGFRLGIRAPSRPPQMVLAGMNPAMLRLAGEIADAVLLAYPMDEERARMVELVREGEERAARPPGACRVMAYVRCYRGDLDEHLDELRRELLAYVMAPGYARRFRRTRFADEVEAVRAGWVAGDRQGAVASVSSDFVRALTLAGGPQELRDGVERHAADGIDKVVVVPLALAGWGSVEDSLHALAPAGANAS